MSDSDSGARPRWTRGDPDKGTGAVEIGALARTGPDAERRSPAQAPEAGQPGSDSAPQTSQNPDPVAPAEPADPARLDDSPAALTESPLQGAPWPRDAAPAASARVILTGSGDARLSAPEPREERIASSTQSEGPAAEAAPAAPVASPPLLVPPSLPRLDPPPVRRSAESAPVERLPERSAIPQARMSEASFPKPSEHGPAEEEVHRPYLAGVDPRMAPKEDRGRGRWLIGVGVLAVLAAISAAAFWPRADGGPAEQATAPAAQEETGSVSEAGLYLPPDKEAVRDAYAEVGRVFRVAGVSGLAESARGCFADLAAQPTYRGLDYCSAVDAFGAAFARRASGAAPAADSWFGQSEARYLQTAGVVMGPDRDAAVRLVEIRRLAIEVARESGPAFAAAAPPQPTPLQPAPPSAGSVQVQTVEPSSTPQATPPRSAATPPTQSVTARRAQAPQAPPPDRSARVDNPRTPARSPGELDREAYAAARRPASGPTAAEVAAARPRAGRGPSFNCRSARTSSERLVCADPELARLDRRLNAAFEDAIAAGADRRTLRREQDGWLGVRERAAPDPDAVADAYLRRIEELDSIR